MAFERYLNLAMLDSLDRPHVRTHENVGTTLECRRQHLTMMVCDRQRLRSTVVDDVSLNTTEIYQC